ncbi:MAG: hypothetical protein FJ398_23740 [Verrucomicrobia bacterium]|nr:hypothetical protein [Verrucomicrobiota bacterium]
MTRPPQPDTFTLTLRALPGWPTRFNARPPEQRLRAALKRLLRDHGLRCESFEPAKGANPQTADS